MNNFMKAFKLNRELQSFKLMDRRENLESYLRGARDHLKNIDSVRPLSVFCGASSSSPVKIDYDLAEMILKESIARAEKDLAQVIKKLQAVEDALNLMSLQEAKANG